MAKEVKTAEFVSALRADKLYGRDATKHYILKIGVKNPDTEVTHYAELPLIFAAGEEWAFYDRASNTSKARKLVAKDTADAIDHARKVFPEWAKFCDELPLDASPSEAFKWFDHHAGEGISVRASFSERSYTATDGTPKTAHEAVVYEQFEAAMPTDFDVQFGKALKASGVKLGRMAAKAAAPAPAAPVAAPTAPASKAATKDDAWAAYVQGPRGAADPQGAQYWEAVAAEVGKPASGWKTYTSEDWQKCVSAFALPF